MCPYNSLFHFIFISLGVDLNDFATPSSLGVTKIDTILRVCLSLGVFTKFSKMSTLKDMVKVWCHDYVVLGREILGGKYGEGFL